MTTDRLTYPHRRRGLDHDWFLARADVRASAGRLAGRQAASRCGSRCPSNFFRSTRRRSRSVRSAGSTAGYPDFWSYSNRDYGTRIGIYRIMRVLDSLGLRATAAVNATAATRYPRVIDEIVRRNWEIVANGIDMGHVHHGQARAGDASAS